MTGDSSYASQLRQLHSGARFPAAIEAHYTQARLFGSRTVIRAATLLALLLVVVRIGTQLIAGAMTGLWALNLLLVAASSALLSWLAWGPAFSRRYLPCAEFVIPVRSTVSAAYFAVAAAHGEPELLMMVPLMLISPFFFLGLRFRAALLTAILSVASFLTAAVLSGLGTAIVGRTTLFLTVGLITCVLAGRQLDRQARQAFIENQLMTEMARRDALTGATNRRVFDEHLVQVWAQAAAAGGRLAVLIIDVDHFKAYNDRYGHLAGDAALQDVARAVQGFVRRPLDLLARYGGEEFAVLLHDVGVPQAFSIADEMRRAVSARGIEHCSSRTAAVVTVSIGVAAIRPTPGRDCRGALQLADQALYDAKLQGRNLVQLRDDEDYMCMKTGVFHAAAVAQRVTA